MSEQKMKPELTKAELDRLAEDTQVTITEFEAMDTTQLTTEQKNEREETLDQAYDLGCQIELRLIGLLLGELTGKLNELKRSLDAESESAEGGSDDE